MKVLCSFLLMTLCCFTFFCNSMEKQESQENLFRLIAVRNLTKNPVSVNSGTDNSEVTKILPGENKQIQISKYQEFVQFKLHKVEKTTTITLGVAEITE